MEIIGREREREILRRCENSDKPEFVAIYGRRRVGKTYLVVEHFHNKFTFSVTGVSDGKTKDQLRVFHSALKKHFQSDIPEPKNWFDAFILLEEQLEKDITLARKVLFIDEMPWLDTPKSNFLPALEHFWNSYASRRKDILLIVCGSAASWIIKNLMNSYGGLHNRLTENIVVEPYYLYECEAFYRSRGIAMTRHQMAEAYMILGGIPFYMDAMNKMYGLNQNIDMLLFENNAKLENEFNRLYNSLFRHADNHISIAKTLAKNNTGMTRKELSQASGVSDGGGLTKVLEEMVACGLIGRSFDISKKRNGDYYKLVDFYTLFYFKYIETQKGNDPRFWTNYLSYPAHRTWCGYAFERLSIAHSQQIKQKLGISGVLSETYVFRSIGQRGVSSGAQIDLVIDRKDDVINLCECKFTVQPYELTEKDLADFERKKTVFLQETATKKAIHLTMITSSGLVHNAYRNEIQSEITLDDLFQPLL
ncbi:MAG: AAA family ATPase [Oscillospiraceae bacterium]|nr:AAA family ATPase [Oscillospiraceae bacterium]